MTLIDKAEALAAIDAWFAETKSFAPPSLRAAIAAIPARGVGEYTLAPHLQKIVDGAKTAPQWDTQADRLAALEPAPTAADAREAALRADEMLRVAARYIRNHYPEGLIRYDDADCDGACVADDCEAAADALIGETRA